MDPDTNLEEMLSLIEDLREQYEQSDDDNPVVDAHDTARLLDLIEAPDGWIRKGGFLPEVWRR